jgi:RHS repeat-associated protein
LSCFWRGPVLTWLQCQWQILSISKSAFFRQAQIDNQGGSNYSYDRIGNLIGDVSENISQVNWTVYGKIGNIQKKQAFLGYVYNAGGERVVKQYLPYATNQCLGCDENTGLEDLEVYERNSAIPDTFKASKTVTFLSEYTEDERYREYSAIIDAGLALCTPQCAARPALNTSDADIYIRDATGNVLAVYHYDRKTSQLRWTEQHLYGSARLGMYLPEKSVTSVSTDSKQREVGYLGKQVFELSNHLGNVLATITDKKLQVSLNTTSTAYFEADVQTVQDYYAFGMQMPGRKLSGGYRFGFNGKENDNEVKGEGNQQDYGMRIYDGRIANWFSIDPLQKKYPCHSPYSFVANNPILYFDLDGRDKVVTVTYLNKDGSKTIIRKTDESYFKYKASVISTNAWDNFIEYKRANVYVDVVIDLANPKNNSYAERTGTYYNTEFWSYSKLSDAVSWIDSKLFSGSESNKVKYGYQIYGSDKHNSEWQNGLPKAADGSESIDLGEMLDLVGNLREGASIVDLLPVGRLKGVIERTEVFLEAFENLNEISSLVDETSRKNSSDKSLKLEPVTLILPPKKGTWTGNSITVKEAHTKKSKNENEPDTIYIQPYTVPKNNK